MKKITDPKDYILFLLSKREYSAAEIRKKCNKKFPERQMDVENLITLFEQKKWLSNDRFMESFIRDQIRNNIGPRLIVEKLWIKGIPKNTAKQKISEIYLIPEQIEKSKILAEKKKTEFLRKTPKISDFELKGKIYQYLIGRGFEPEFNE